MMIKQMLAMFGVDENEIEEMKAGVLAFEKRFAAMESKINLLYAAHLPEIESLNLNGAENDNTLGKIGE